MHMRTQSTRLHRVIVLALALLLTGIVPGCRRRMAEAAPGGSTSSSPTSGMRSIKSAGLERSYLLHLPTGYSAKRRYPLVVILHGSKGDSKQVAEQTGMSSKADAEKFVVVYPQGIGKSWADGRGVSDADEKGVDDVAFIRDLVAKLRSELSIDPKRIYAGGISNGAMMASRLACDMTDTFAAIGTVAGRRL